jgi:flagellar biosynthesis protein FlhB
MAEENDTADKTEDPTQKRLDDAHDRGDVAKSQEINTWFLISGGTLVLSTFSASIGGGILMPLRNLIANSWMIHADGPGLLALAQSLEYVLIATMGVPLLMLALAAIAGNMIQHRLVWSGESLKPKFSKISPMAGAKRIFGKQAVANFGKGIFKVVALGAVMSAVLWPERHRLEAMVRLDPAEILGLTTSLTVHLLGAVVAMLAVVAIADYFFQYRQWFERQKMSLQEMKEEFKQSEGDPQIRGRIRQLRQARMKKRMMAAVPKASVVITNPTHYAVALSYERGMSAPVCVAQGRRHHRPQDQGNRRPARHPHRRERAAGTGFVCHRGNRRGDSGGTLSRGRRNHRLRDGSQARAFRLAGVNPVRGNECPGNAHNERNSGLTDLRLRVRFRHSGGGARKARRRHADRLRSSYDRRY